MKSQILHTVWGNISSKAAGEIGNWSLLGVKGLCNALEKGTPPRSASSGMYYWSTRRYVSKVNSVQVPRKVECIIYQTGSVLTGKHLKRYKERTHRTMNKQMHVNKEQMLLISQHLLQTKAMTGSSHQARGILGSHRNMDAHDLYNWAVINNNTKWQSGNTHPHASSKNSHWPTRERV